MGKIKRNGSHFCSSARLPFGPIIYLSSLLELPLQNTGSDTHLGHVSICDLHFVKALLRILVASP